MSDPEVSDEPTPSQQPQQPQQPLEPLEPPQPAGSSGKRRAALLGGIGTGVVALAVVLVVALSGGTSKGGNEAKGAGTLSTTGTSQRVWSKASLGGEFIGTWVNGNDLVVGSADSLTAYVLTTGAQDWTWSVPAGQTICRMSQSTSNQHGAVMYGRAEECGNLQALDLATGHAMWPTPVSLMGPYGENPYLSGIGLVIQGSYVLAPYAQGDAVDLDLSTGRPVWNTSQNTAMKDCTIDGAAMVSTTVYYATTGSCGGGGPGPQIWDRDAASAAPATTMNLPPTCGDSPGLQQIGGDLLMVCDTRVGGDPTVFLATPGSSSFLTVNATNPGFRQLRVGASGVGLQVRLDGVAAYGNTLYLPDATGDMDFNAVTAVDLSTGKVLWTAPTTAKSEPPFAATSAGVISGYVLNLEPYILQVLSASSGTPSTRTTLAANAWDAQRATEWLAGDYYVGADPDPITGQDQLVVYRLTAAEIH
jgi:outer membrane protein assembly factor BamB